MRIRLLILIFFAFLVLLLWVSTAGFFFSLGVIFITLFLVITAGYSDACVLFFLGAREIRSNSHESFFLAASQEAYKLEVPMPHLYFYNGSIERGFILQNRNDISIVLSKKLLDSFGIEELSAVCFELLVQAKNNMASKRTKVMFILGLNSWIVYSISSIFLNLFRSREIRKTFDWFIIYFLHPWHEFMFKFVVGEKYFNKLQITLRSYPAENELLERIRLKIRRPDFLYSLASKRLIEFGAIYKNSNYQSILALEFLPHEWNYLLDQEDAIRVKQA